MRSCGLGTKVKNEKYLQKSVRKTNLNRELDDLKHRWEIILSAYLRSNFWTELYIGLLIQNDVCDHGTKSSDLTRG
jgi:hypothetical protein